MARAAAQAERWRGLARGLFWAGLAASLIGPALLIAGLRGPGGLIAGLGLIALGLNILIGREVIVGAGTRSFTAHGAVVRAKAEIGAGLCDLAIRAETSPGSRLAVLRCGPLGSPDFYEEGGVGYLKLASSPLQPNVAGWQADLAANALWDVAAFSSLGDLSLDLRDLRLETVQARTWSGAVRVICPARGYVKLDLRSAIGEISVTLPPGEEVGVRVSVRRGPLASLTVRSKRLKRFNPRYFITPDFETAQTQLEISIDAAAGDIIIT